MHVSMQTTHHSHRGRGRGRGNFNLTLPSQTRGGILIPRRGAQLDSKDWGLRLDFRLSCNDGVRLVRSLASLA